jgi:hypothetical protein
VVDRTKERRIRNAQRPGDWKSLAERASHETDPEKLMNVVVELNGVLEEQQRNYHIWDRRSHENRSLIDPNFDSLRARVWERSARALLRQRVQEIAMTVLALVLGSVAGWVVVR